jgi:hypothetical protein
MSPSERSTERWQPLNEEKSKENTGIENKSQEMIAQEIETAHIQWDELYAASKKTAEIIKTRIDSIYQTLPQCENTELQGQYNQIWQLIESELQSIVQQIDDAQSLHMHQDLIMQAAKIIDEGENTSLKIVEFIREMHETKGILAKEQGEINQIEQRDQKKYFQTNTETEDWQWTFTSAANKPNLEGILWNILHEQTRWGINYKNCSNQNIKNTMKKVLWWLEWYIEKRTDSTGKTTLILLNTKGEIVNARPLIWEWVQLITPWWLKKANRKKSSWWLQLPWWVNTPKLWNWAAISPVTSIIAHKILQQNHQGLSETMQTLPEHIQNYFIPIVEVQLEQHIHYAKSHGRTILKWKMFENHTTPNELMHIKFSTPQGITQKVFLNSNELNIPDTLFKLLQKHQEQLWKYLEERMNEKRYNYNNIPIRKDLLAEQARANQENTSQNKDLLKQKNNLSDGWRLLREALEYTKKKTVTHDSSKWTIRKECIKKLDDISYTLQVNPTLSYENLQYLETEMIVTLTDLYKWEQKDKSIHEAEIKILLQELIRPNPKSGTSQNKAKSQTIDKLIQQMNQYVDTDDKLMPMEDKDRKELWMTIPTNDQHKSHAHQ